MPVTFHQRRAFLQMLAATTASACLAAPRAASAATRDAVIEAAKGEGGLVWYDHYVTVRRRKAFGRLPARLSLRQKGRVRRRSVGAEDRQDHAGEHGRWPDDLRAPPRCCGDAITLRAGPRAGGGLGALGVATSPVLTPTSYMIVATTAPYVVLYNTDLVKPADVPNSWNDAFDPKWKGHTGHWLRASSLSRNDPGARGRRGTRSREPSCCVTAASVRGPVSAVAGCGVRRNCACGNGL